MPRIIVIAGSPGAGKSTLIAGLRPVLGGPHASIGKLRSFHLKPDWSDRHPAEEAMGFENLVFVLKNYARHGYTNVLVDDLRDYRVVQMPDVLAGIAVRILTLTVSDDAEVRRRIVARASGFSDAEEAAAWNRAVIDRPTVAGETRIETMNRPPADVLAAALALLAE